MNILINLSNHPSTRWAEDQKKGFDKIIDIPFPNIPSNFNSEQVFHNYVKNYFEQVQNISKNEKTTNIMLQGEFSFCHMMIRLLESDKENTWRFHYPTTERRVIENRKEDGSIEKITEFKFVGWRII